MGTTFSPVKVALENTKFSRELLIIPPIKPSFFLSSRSILSKDGVLYVKLRAGQLSYKEDPMGWQSLLAQTVANRNSEARAFKVVLRFTSVFSDRL
jgi:hypothetical protein